MNSIFEGCVSLKLIDISYFNMIGGYIFNDMFTNTKNIIYINIKNMQNDRTIGNIFNNKKEIFYAWKTTNITDEKMPEFITTGYFDNNILEKSEEENDRNEIEEEIEWKRKRKIIGKTKSNWPGKSFKKKG